MKYFILISKIMIDIADCHPRFQSNLTHGSVFVSFLQKDFFSRIQNSFLYIFFQKLHNGDIK